MSIRRLQIQRGATEYTPKEQKKKIEKAKEKTKQENTSKGGRNLLTKRRMYAINKYTGTAVGLEKQRTVYKNKLLTEGMKQEKIRKAVLKRTLRESITGKKKLQKTQKTNPSHGTQRNGSSQRFNLPESRKTRSKPIIFIEAG